MVGYVSVCAMFALEEDHSSHRMEKKQKSNKEVELTGELIDNKGKRVVKAEEET